MFIIKLVNRVALDSTSRREQWFWKGCKPPARPPNGPEDSAMVSWCSGWLVGWDLGRCGQFNDTPNINKHIRKEKYVAVAWCKNKTAKPPLQVFFGIMSLISIEIIDLLVVSGQPWVPASCGDRFFRKLNEESHFRLCYIATRFGTQNIFASDWTSNYLFVCFGLWRILEQYIPEDGTQEIDNL